MQIHFPPAGLIWLLHSQVSFDPRLWLRLLGTPQVKIKYHKIYSYQSMRVLSAPSKFEGDIFHFHLLHFLLKLPALCTVHILLCTLVFRAVSLVLPQVGAITISWPTVTRCSDVIPDRCYERSVCARPCRLKPHNMYMLWWLWTSVGAEMWLVGRLLQVRFEGFLLLF